MWTAKVAVRVVVDSWTRWTWGLEAAGEDEQPARGTTAKATPSRATGA
jgi:hypothetical protein